MFVLAIKEVEMLSSFDFFFNNWEKWISSFMEFVHKNFIFIQLKLNLKSSIIYTRWKNPSNKYGVVIGFLSKNYKTRIM